MCASVGVYVSLLTLPLLTDERGDLLLGLVEKGGTLTVTKTRVAVQLDHRAGGGFLELFADLTGVRTGRRDMSTDTRPRRGEVNVRETAIQETQGRPADAKGLGKTTTVRKTPTTV